MHPLNCERESDINVFLNPVVLCLLPMIKFLIYKYYSHQENVSTFQYLGNNNNQSSAPVHFSHVVADNNKTPTQCGPSEVMFMDNQ